jgi:sporulation protein YlmC with PRC-barrel domain
LKFGEIIDKKVYTGDYFVGKVKDLYVDEEEWKITHLEVELTKEAANELLGAKTAFRNSLAISALGKWPDCCSNDQIKLGVTKGQLNIYLRPPK